MGALWSPLQSLGVQAMGFVFNAWDLLRFSVGSVAALSRFFSRQGFRASSRVIVQQVYFTGLEAFPFLGLLSLLLGSTVIVQSLPQLQGMGAGGMIGKILVISIVRELGPIITAMVVITRSGTAMAAEMATNRITGQVEALEAMGVDVFHYLIAPRVVGSMVSVFCMVVYFDVVALIGGFLVASIRLTMPFTLYLDYILDTLRPLDLWISLCKSVLFGLVISLFSCYHGLRARRAPFEVPMVARLGVMQAMFFVFVSSAVISAVFYWI
ncbi:MAG: ABC transporter permease [Candidatus Latescibacterota bacterium]|nr:ABC transporter permease [Candidatus Latescibacterota bacterium]